MGGHDQLEVSNSNKEEKEVQLNNENDRSNDHVTEPILESHCIEKEEERAKMFDSGHYIRSYLKNNTLQFEIQFSV